MKFKVGDKVVASPASIKYWITAKNIWWNSFSDIKNIKEHVFIVSTPSDSWGVFGTTCGKIFFSSSFILVENILSKEQQIINKIQWLYKNSKCELEKKWVKE